MGVAPSTAKMTCSIPTAAAAAAAAALAKSTMLETTERLYRPPLRLISRPLTTAAATTTDMPRSLTLSWHTDRRRDGRNTHKCIFSKEVRVSFTISHFHEVSWCSGQYWRWYSKKEIIASLGPCCHLSL